MDRSYKGSSANGGGGGGSIRSRDRSYRSGSRSKRRHHKEQQQRGSSIKNQRSRSSRGGDTIFRERAIDIRDVEEDDPISPMSSTSTTSYGSSSSSENHHHHNDKGTSSSNDVVSTKNVGVDIMQYQKNVSGLGQLVYSLDGNQSELWKCRLQIESNQRLGKEIEKSLEKQQIEIKYMEHRSDAVKARSMHAKLMKDFMNYKASFKNLKLEFKRRQHMSDVRLLEEQEQGGGGGSSSSRQHLGGGGGNLQMQMDDDFNEYVMRERETEVKEINTKMHKVNDIFKDLGQIVHDQQEHVDKVEEMVDESYGHTKSGLRHLETANGKPTETDEEFERRMKQKTTTPRDALQRECNFTLPLEEWGIDVTEVKREITEFGSDMLDFGKDTYHYARSMVFDCAARNQFGGRLR